MKTDEEQHIAVLNLTHMEMGFVMASMATAMEVAIPMHSALDRTKIRIAYLEASMALGKEGTSELLNKMIKIAEAQCKATGCGSHG